MAYYMVQLAFKPEAMAALLNDPQERLDALRPTAENLGGSLDGGWLSFGEYDMVLLLEMPGNVGATAFSTAVSKGNTIRALKITPMMTIQEGMEATQQAADEAAARLLPAPEIPEEPEIDPEQVQELIAPNLEYAAACAESAYQVLKELGIHGTLPTVDTAIARGVHFLQLAQHYLEELQQQLPAEPPLLHKGGPPIPGEPGSHSKGNNP